MASDKVARFSETQCRCKKPHKRAFQVHDVNW